jgi:uncharacterized protein
MPKSDAEPSLASRLCLACGMCCDGTVYNVARLEQAEVARAAAEGFRTCNSEFGHDAFNLPCHYLSGTACTIYQAWRPGVCSSYFCAVQDKARDGEMTEAQALEIIARTLDCRDQVLAAKRPDETLAQARVRFAAITAAKDAIAPQDAKFVVQMFVLEKMLDQHFRKQGEERLRNAAPDAPAITASAGSSAGASELSPP